MKYLKSIIQIAEKESITIGGIEREIGASKAVLSRAIKNKSDISAKWLHLIVEKYPKYNPTWLLTGEGEMLRQEKTGGERVVFLKEKIEMQEKIIDGLEKQVELLEKQLNQYENAATL